MKKTNKTNHSAQINGDALLPFGTSEIYYNIGELNDAIKTKFEECRKTEMENSQISFGP